MSARPHEQPMIAETSRPRRLSHVVRLLSGALAWPRIGYAALILAVAVGAFMIRAWTVCGSLPYVDHPDEPNPINYVVGMLRTGDPNPHAFQKPSLYVYLLLTVLAAHYRWGRASGLYGALDQMTITTHLYTTIPGFFIWGRLLTAAIGALTVVMIYRLGSRVWSRGAGLIAALVLALSPFHIRHSQYVTTDVTSALLVLLAFGASIAVARRGRWRDYLAAGAFAGLAASAKYNAGVAALMVVAAHLIYWWNPHPPAPAPVVAEAGAKVPAPSPASAGEGGQGDDGRLIRPLLHLPRLIAAGIAALLGFLAGTPYAALSWGEFREGILGQVKDYGENAHGDFTGAWNLRGYLGFFWDDGLGWMVCLAALAGLALLLWRPGPGRGRMAGLLLLSFAVPYVLLHLAQTSHFTRNMMPLIVLSALLAGVTGAALIEKVKGKRQKVKVLDLFTFYLLPFTFVVALLLPSTVETWRYTARLRRGDTRVQAMAWMAANVPPGVRVAAELRPLPGPLDSPWAEAPGLLRHDLAWYRQQGYAYAIASSDTWRQGDIPETYRNFAGSPPLAEFGGPETPAMLGPHLVVFATGLSKADVPEPLAGPAWAGGARLLGMGLGLPDAKAPALGVTPSHRFKPGQMLGLRTFWSVEQPLGQDFFIFVHLVDASGNTVAQRDAPPWQGRFPTSSWHAGTIVVDVNDVQLPAELPPGVYTLRAGMFDPATGAHPPMSVDGLPVDTIPLGEITVELKAH